MVQRRINLSDLVFDEPLPWDLYPADPAAGPLLRKGQLLSDRLALGRMVESGLFAADAAPPSVLNLLNQSNQRLALLLHELRNKSDAEREVRDVARDVMQAVELNPDIALACIFLSQIAGTYAIRHCIETAVVAVLVARGMDKPARETLAITTAALTMNVGMLRHADTFQNKRSALSSEEMAIVRRHPEESVDLLTSAGVRDEEWISCVLLHHENDDGSGYPCGKTSDDITQNARLIGLADRYCAQVSARNYRRSMLPDQAMDNIFMDRQQSIDPALAEQFARQLGKYPPGSLVRLQNGTIGVVARRQWQGGAIEVQALRDASGALIKLNGDAAWAARSIEEPGYGIAEVLHEDQADVRFSMKLVWGEQATL
ncbi:MAG: HD domain-containing phosphohydrolase [Pseudomonadota bacterium]